MTPMALLDSYEPIDTFEVMTVHSVQLAGPKLLPNVTTQKVLLVSGSRTCHQ